MKILKLERDVTAKVIKPINDAMTILRPCWNSIWFTAPKMTARKIAIKMGRKDKKRVHFETFLKIPGFLFSEEDSLKPIKYPTTIITAITGI